MVNHFRSLPFLRLLCDLNIEATTFPFGMMSRKTQALISGKNSLGHPLRKIDFHCGGQIDGCAPSGPMGHITYFCNACASQLPAHGYAKHVKNYYSVRPYMYITRLWKFGPMVCPIAAPPAPDASRNRSYSTPTFLLEQMFVWLD